jgi:FixJ family two-component response regulator
VALPTANTDERQRVLLVEDDAAVRRALQLLLQSHGYDVRAYRSGSGLSADPEAMRAAYLVADLRIPNGDAIGLLGELRGAGWSGAGLLISGHLTDDIASRALAGGYSAALPKPIAESVLVNCLAGLVGSDAATAVAAE